MRNQTLERTFAYFRKKAQQAWAWLLAPDAPAASDTALEKRILLSANPVITDLGSGIFEVTTDCPDDTIADEFVLDRTGGNIRVTLNGTSATIGAVADVTKITIIGSGDEDTFTIDHDAIVQDGVFVEGSGGFDVVNIEEVGNPDFDSIDYSISDTSTTVTLNQAGTDPDLVVDIMEAEQINETLDAPTKSITSTGSIAQISAATTASTIEARFGTDLSASTDLLIVMDQPTDAFAVNTNNSDVQQFTVTSFTESGIDLTVTGDSSDSIEMGSVAATQADAILIDGGNVTISNDLTASQTLTVQNTTSFVVNGSAADVAISTLSGDIVLASDLSLAGGNDISILSGNGSISLVNVSGVSDSLLADLAIVADNDINFTNIDLEDTAVGAAGSLVLRLNADGGTAQDLELNASTTLGSINSFTFFGNSTSDSLTIGSDIVAAGFLSVQNAQIVVNATANAVQLKSGGGGITLDGDVALQGGNLVTLEANAGGVSLQSVADADDGLVADLTITSDESISFTSIDLADTTAVAAGDLSLTINADGTGAAQTLNIQTGQTIGDVGQLTLSGGAATDAINISSSVTTSVAGMVVQNALIDVTADLNAATSITLQQSSNIDVAANLTAGTSISVLNATQFIIDSTSNTVQLQSNDGDITFGSDVALAGGNFVTLDANGGGVSLHSVSGVDDGLVADLTVTSDDSISFTNIDLADSTAGSSGHLALTINADGAGAAQTLNIQTGQTIGDVGQLTLSGGAATDAINISSSVTTSVAEIVVHNALIDVTADLNAATSIALQQSDNISVAATSLPGLRSRS